MKVRSRPAHWPTATLVKRRDPRPLAESNQDTPAAVIVDAGGARDVPARGGLTGPRRRSTAWRTGVSGPVPGASVAPRRMSIRTPAAGDLGEPRPRIRDLCSRPARYCSMRTRPHTAPEGES